MTVAEENLPGSAPQVVPMPGKRGELRSHSERGDTVQPGMTSARIQSQTCLERSPQSTCRNEVVGRTAHGIGEGQSMGEQLKRGLAFLFLADLRIEGVAENRRSD